MKYYLYISDTKVDMLYSQIPKRIVDNLGAELKINLIGISASIGRKSVDETRYSKLKVVIDYIEENEDVGTIDVPKEYFKGTLPMRWGPYGGNWDSKKLVYFGGYTDQTVLGLGGSLSHILGSKGESPAQSQSVTPYLLSTLDKELKLPLPPPHAARDEEEISEREVFIENNLVAICIANQEMKGPKEQLEFLARRLLYEPRLSSDLAEAYCKCKRKILLGTPIYVAKANCSEEPIDTQLSRLPNRS